MAQTALQYANSRWMVSVPRHGSVAEFEASPQQQAQRRLHCRGPDPGRNIRSTTAALRRADRRGIVSHASERRTYVIKKVNSRSCAQMRVHGPTTIIRVADCPATRCAMRGWHPSASALRRCRAHCCTVEEKRIRDRSSYQCRRPNERVADILRCIAIFWPGVLLMHIQQREPISTNVRISGICHVSARTTFECKCFCISRF